LVTFVGVSEQTTERIPCAETLREVLLAVDSSLRSAPRATFVSRTFCAGVYFVGFEGRTLMDLRVEDFDGVNFFVTRRRLTSTCWSRFAYRMARLKNVRGGDISETAVINAIDGSAEGLSPSPLHRRDPAMRNVDLDAQSSQTRLRYMALTSGSASQ
jgi:hypothetical protein